MVQRLAQPPDVDVDRPRVDVRIVRPDRVQQSFSREDPARMLEEVLEQAELGRTECDLFTVAANPVAGDIHFEVGINELLACERLREPSTKFTLRGFARVGGGA